MNSKISISILGSGNVATHLSNYFHKKGIKIDVIFNHKLASAKELATKVNCPFTTHPEEIPLTSTIYLLALPNQHIKSTLKQLKLKDQFLVHTSGSFNSELLQKHTNRWGCFYPMQTFVKNQTIKLKDSSIFIEAKNAKDKEILEKLCLIIECNCHFLNSKQRQQLHIGAIATNNFSYHLFSCIQEYFIKHNLPYSTLQPLLEETLKKIALQEPFSHQSGPAIRNEESTIENHLNLLANEKYLAEIYHLFSKQIKNKHEL